MREILFDWMRSSWVLKKGIGHNYVNLAFLVQNATLATCTVGLNCTFTDIHVCSIALLQ